MGSLPALTSESTVERDVSFCLMNELPMYADCQHDGLEVSKWLEERVVNLPSSVPERIKAQG